LAVAAAVTSGFLLVSLGDDDGDGFAARQGVTIAQPRRSALRQAKRRRPEADDGLRFCMDFERRVGQSASGPLKRTVHLSNRAAERKRRLGTGPAKQKAAKTTRGQQLLHRFA